MTAKSKKSEYSMQVHDLTVHISRRRVKNVNLYIHPSTGKILVTAPRFVEDAYIRMFLERKYQWMLVHYSKVEEKVKNERSVISAEEIKKLQILVRKYAEKWEPVMNVHCVKWTFRDMKTRWGSCTVNRATIRINVQLANKPETCVEYIVVHELTHLLEASHNRVFKTYMTQFLPDWKERDQLLRQS